MAACSFPVRLRPFVPLILLGWLGGSPCFGQQPQAASYDVEGIYLQGYMSMQDAEKLEDRRNFAGAYYKYKEASDVFDSVARTNPGWQTSMVGYRRGLIRKKMEEMRQRERDRRATNSAAPGSDLLPPLESPTGSDPVLVAPPAAPPTAPASPSTSAAGPIDHKLAEMQRQVAGINAENQRLQETMQAKEGELFKVKQELLANKQELNAAFEQQIELQNKLNTADKKRDRELSEVKAQLAEATSALQKATKSQDEAVKRVDELMRDLGGARETIARLTSEKAALVEERNQMLAIVKRDGDNKATDVLIEENRRLKGLLEEANAKVGVLTKDKVAAVKEAGALREEIASVRDELERTKKENEDYRRQIAGLRTKLEEATEKLLAAAPSGKDDSELAEENRILRRTILDQLKHQAYREQKKRLALEQLAILQINNDELLSAINDLAAPPPALSADEKSILQDPQMERFVEGQSVGATILTRADGGPAPAEAAAPAAPAESTPRMARGRHDLPPDLQTVAEAGLDAFRRDRAWEAERAFNTILKNDPTNVFALTNAAVSQVKQRRFSQAEKNLKKALAYQEQDAFSHYLLGVVAYRQNNLEEAERTLRIALGLDAKNARAHFTLGCVHHRRGRAEDACREFLVALEVDPAFADAHYNLAVIYANRNDTARAANHYNKAIENGSDRDPQLEKAIGPPLGAG